MDAVRVERVDDMVIVLFMPEAGACTWMSFSLLAFF